MSKKKLWIALGIAVTVIVVVLVSLPFLIDVNRYRGLIESKAEETLGREVELGEMRLSIFPLGVRIDDLGIGALPDEDAEDFLTAGEVRVGARLMPLLGGRLEVTSIVIEQPRLSLVRGADGQWNLQRLIATPAQPPVEEAPDETGSALPEFEIGELRIRDGRITVRDQRAEGEPLQLTLTELDVRLRNVAMDRPVDFELSTSWEEIPDAKLELAGRVGPLVPPEGESMRVEADLDLDRLDVARLLEVVRGLYPVPRDLVGGEALSLEAGLDATLGAATRIAVSDVEVDGLQVNLRRDAKGKWNLPEPAAGDAGPVAAVAEAEAEATPVEFALSGLTVRDAVVRYEDAALEGGPLAVSLEDLDITLDRLPMDGPATLELAAMLEGTGKLGVRGQIGPVAPGGGEIPLDVTVELDRVPDSMLRMVTAEGLELDTSSGQASLRTQLSGTAPARIRARGGVEVKGFRARVAGPDGAPRDVPLDVGLDYDLEAIDGGQALQIDKLAVQLSGNTVTVKGSVRNEAPLQRVDIELLPCRLPADDLMSLLSLVAGELPVSFSSASPLELHGRVRGLIGEGRIPRIDGTAKLRDFTFMHALLEQPVTQVGATVKLEGEHVEIAGLTGVIGSSDLSGDVRLDGFEKPRVGFSLHSRNADFGELFSFLNREEQPPQNAAPAEVPEEEEEDLLKDMILDGDIRIDRGAFDTLKFTALDAHMRWEKGVLTLEPVRMDLYDGTFNGRVISELGGVEPTFDVYGDARGVDIDNFLGESLGTPGLLFGKFFGKVDTRTRGADYEAIVRGLEGTGSVEVQEGRIGGLDILETLSSVSGLFGESTLQSLSSRLAADGTAFDTMSGEARFDAGKMRVQDLIVESTDFKLVGDGDVDLLAATLAGDFRLAMSPELSASMRAESSRAGKLFWNPRSRQVEMPFRLTGPFTEPTPSIDWNAVADAAVKGRAEDEVRKWVGKRLGLKSDDPPAPAPNDTAPPASSLDAATDTAPVVTPEPATGPAGTTSNIVIEFTRTEWRGSFFAPDLVVEGTVQGAGIDHVELTFVDSDGARVRGPERLPDIDAFFASSPDRSAAVSIPWRYRLDGKKVLLARFPVTVRVVAFDGSGGTREGTLEVDR